MALASAGRASYRWLIITLLVVAGGYGWYASGQYDRLNDLNQRQLSNAGAELKAAFETALETVTRFTVRRAKASVNPPSICDFDQSQPYLTLAACADGEPALEGISWKDVKTLPATTPALGITIETGHDTSHVQLRLAADALLAELAFPDSFELIVIAGDDGQILYQDAPDRRRWLRHLRWGEQSFRDSTANRPPTLQVRNLQQLLGGEPQWKQLKAVSSQTRVQMGGTSHQLYLQPLMIEHEKKPLNLVIAGAVPTRFIIRDALALDTSWVGILVFLLLLGIAGFPFVKLWFLSPRERFRLRDVVLLYLSTGVLLVLVTCGALALDGYVRWQAVADKGLEGLARNLEERFITEITTIRNAVVDYDKVAASLPPIECGKPSFDTMWFGTTPGSDMKSWPADIHLRQIVWVRQDGWQMRKVTADPTTGGLSVDERFYFRAVQDESLFQLPDSDQPFYLGPDRSLTDGKFYTYFSMPSTHAFRNCPDPNRPSKEPAVVSVSATSKKAVVAAWAYLLSLDRQPLPAGYGFAVINREGRVLYHSDGRLSLRENLYEELSGGGRARSMVYAGRSGMLNTGYRERPHHFYLHEMRLRRANEPSSAGFYVATFRNVSVERATVGHVFVSGLVGPMLVLLAIYAAAMWGLALASRFNTNHWSAWLWPHGGLNHVYQWQALAFGALLVAATTCYLRSGSVGGFLFTPPLAAAAAIGIYVWGSRRMTSRSHLSAPIWHTLAILLALTCLIVTPSAVMFRLALSHEFAKLILTEREWIRAQEHDAILAAKVEARKADYAPLRVDELAASRWRLLGCIPTPFDIGPGEPLPAEPGRRSDAVHAVHVKGGPAPTGATLSADERGPERCETARDGIRVLDRRASTTLQTIGMYEWAVGALHPLDGMLPIEDHVMARVQSQRRTYAYSPDGTLLAWIPTSSVALIGLVVALALLVWWIRWNANRVFFADQETPAEQPPGPADDLWPEELDDQMVLLQVARERVGNPYQSATIRKLLAAGVLKMNPHLCPACTGFDEAFLSGKERELEKELLEWEEVRDGNSWRYARFILIAVVAALAFFLFVTQPALQSSLVGIATGITGALTAILKLREAIVSWLPVRKAAG